MLIKNLKDLGFWKKINDFMDLEELNITEPSEKME